MSQISVDSVIPQSGTTITIGGSGDTVTLGSGASQSGFGSAAYAANASASTGAVNVDASDNLQFNSGYGSTATAYGCRAWIFFDGTGSVTINGSANVSSIVDNGVGNWTVNLTTALPDTNYCAEVTSQLGTFCGSPGSRTTSSFVVDTRNTSLGAYDSSSNNVAIFR